MKNQYDFSNAGKNAYAKLLRSQPLLDEFHNWFRALPELKRNRLACHLADAVLRDGLAVYVTDEDRFHPIPILLTPIPYDPHELRALGREVHILLGAAIKTAQWTLREPGLSLGRRLYRAFTPLEWQCLRQPERLEQVATARADLFIAPDGRPRLLELNATIPAMQGYSDILTHHWIRAVAAERDLSATMIACLLDAAGANTHDLLDSLIAHYQRTDGKQQHPSILIVSRRGDAQLGELLYYERVFNKRGHRTLHAWVDEVELDAQGRVHARGQDFDLLYRHIFARRIPQNSALAQLLIQPGATLVLNPVTSPLEVKALLALLHQAANAPNVFDGLGRLFTDEERHVIQTLVPWTRMLVPGPTTLADGTFVSDLPAWAEAHPQSLVLKASWDYGGKNVFLGSDTSDWVMRIHSAAQEDTAWIVQEFIATPSSPQLVTGPANTTPAWRDFIIDRNIFINHGVACHPSGGVCRAAPSKIVNILGGGGLAPFVPISVLEGCMR